MKLPQPNLIPVSRPSSTQPLPENAGRQAETHAAQTASPANVPSPSNRSLSNSRWGINEPAAQPASRTTPPVRMSTSARWVRFELVAAEARTVFLAGSFNNWSPWATPMMNLHGRKWARELWLPAGGYEYLFVVDGRWTPDPGARASVPNPFGGHNSLLRVERAAT